MLQVLDMNSIIIWHQLLGNVVEDSGRNELEEGVNMIKTMIREVMTSKHGWEAMIRRITRGEIWQDKVLL